MLSIWVAKEKRGTWDIRCPKALKNMFKERAGFWYKVNRKQQKKIIKILCKAYKVRLPILSDKTPPHYGEYSWLSETIKVYGRCHMKSLFHELYHHIDKASDGKYNSSDNRGGETSYGWQFADLMFDALRGK